MPPFAAIVMGAVAAGAAANSADAARKAGHTQADSANAASSIEQQQFNQTQENLQPWMQQGNLAASALNQLTGLQQVMPYQQGYAAQPANLGFPQGSPQAIQGITQDQAMAQYGMTDPANAAKFASLNPATQARLIQLAQSGNKTLFDQAAVASGLVQGTNMTALASMPIPGQGQASTGQPPVSQPSQMATGAPQGAPAQPGAIPTPQAQPGQPSATGVPLSQIGAPQAAQAAPQQAPAITANQARIAGLTDPKNIADFGNLTAQQQAQLIQSAKTGNAAGFSKLAASMGLNPGTRMNVVAGMSSIAPLIRSQPAVPATLAHVGTPAINPLSTQPLGSTDPSAGGTFNPNAPLVKPFSLADFQASPAYQFNLQQGQDAINKASNARGMLYAPQTLQDIGKYSQGVASNEFQNAYQNYNTNAQNIWNRLSQLSGSGQNAAANLGSLGAQTAGQVGQNTIGAGNANAAGQIGQANAINQGIGGAYNAYLMQQMLSQNNQGLYGGDSNYGQRG